MGPRLLLTLVLLQAGEYPLSAPLPCPASPLAISSACFMPGPPGDLAK